MKNMVTVKHDPTRSQGYWKGYDGTMDKFTFMHGHTFGESKMHESTYREGIVYSNGDDFPRIITKSIGTREFVKHFPVGGDMKQAYDALLET